MYLALYNKIYSSRQTHLYTAWYYSINSPDVITIKKLMVGGEINAGDVRSSVVQALKHTAETAEEQLSNLDKCLATIDAHFPPQQPDWTPDTDDDWWWVRHRLQALHHRDLITTARTLYVQEYVFILITPHCSSLIPSFLPIMYMNSAGKWNVECYTALCASPLLETATAIACSGNTTSLLTLLQLHPYSLHSHSLHLLSFLPETLGPVPAIYQPILRFYSSSTTTSDAAFSIDHFGREIDWVEKINVTDTTPADEKFTTEFILQHCRLQRSSDATTSTSNTSTSASYATIVGWIRRRACTIDRLTGQLSLAMDLLTLGRGVVHYSPTETLPLTSLYRCAQQLEVVVKLAATRDAGEASGWRMDLGTWASMDDVGKVQAVMGLTDADALATHDIPRVIVPFLRQLDSSPTTDTTSSSGDTASPTVRVVRRALEREANGGARLSWVVRFIQSESHRPLALGSGAEVAAAAFGAVYASPSVDSWSLQEALLNAAREAISVATSSSGGGNNDPALALALDERQAMALTRTIVAVHGHLTAARLLTKHGLVTSLATVRDATKEEALDMMKTLFARVGRARPAESRWTDLWNDVRAAQEAGLHALPVESIKTELCRALLRCGQLRLAQKHLSTLELSTREELVLGAARDEFYSEGTPDNAAVKRALDVLKTVPDSKAAADEALFITAAAKLRTLGVDMPPLQLRQAPDKAAVLRRAIAVAPSSALKDVDGFVALSFSLRTGLRKGQVLSMVAEAAIASGQSRLAETIVSQLARRDEEDSGGGDANRDGWAIASRLALEEPCSSEAERRRLLSYAIRHAPPEEMEIVLKAWQAGDGGGVGTPYLWTVPSASAATKILEASLSFSAYLSSSEDTTQRGGSGSSSLMQMSSSRGQVHNVDEDNGLLLLQGLLTLGPSAVMQWSSNIEQERHRLSFEGLRRAYVVGIVGAAILIVREQLRGEECCSEDVLMTSSPHDLVMAALGFNPSVPKPTCDDGSSPQPPSLEALQSIIIDLGNRLVASSDAQRVARLLPIGGRGGGGLGGAQREWLEGGAEAQRNVVLRLAAAAGDPSLANEKGIEAFDQDEDGDGNGDGDEDAQEQLSLLLSPRESSSELRSPSRKKSENLSESVLPILKEEEQQRDLPPLLTQALSLGERCGVSAWEVQSTYVAAVVANKSVASIQESQKNVALVWPSLMSVAAHPGEEGPTPTERHDIDVKKAIASMILDAAYPKIDKHEWRRVVWVLQLIAECLSCGDGDTGSGGALMRELSEAVQAMHVACSSINVKVFVSPCVRVLSSCILGDSSGSSGTVYEDQGPSDTLALVSQLMHCCNATNVGQVAKAMDEIVRIYASLSTKEKGTFPVSGSTAHVAALCREFTSMAVTEGVDDEQKGRLHSLFAGAKPLDGLLTAQFACQLTLTTGTSPTAPSAPASPFPPLPRLPAEQLPMILLSQQQSLVVLDVALGACGGKTDSDADAVYLQAREALEKERTRVAVVVAIEDACGNALSPDQLYTLQTIVPEMQSKDGVADGAAVLKNQLAIMMGDGCQFGTLFRLASAYSALIGGTNTHTAVEDIAVAAAVASVQRGLNALPSIGTGTGVDADTMSVGDAIQTVYGTLRSLDARDASASAIGDDDDVTQAFMTTLGKARDLVWIELQRHVSEEQQGGEEGQGQVEEDGMAAAAAEAHLQVLEMLGSLGSLTMWSTWAPSPELLKSIGGGGNTMDVANNSSSSAPTTTDAATTTTAATTATATAPPPFKHAQALLHSRITSVFASNSWASALRESSITPQEFSTVRGTEAALNKIVDHAGSNVDKLKAVVVVLRDVFECGGPGTAHWINANDKEEERSTTDPSPTHTHGHTVHPLHRVWSTCLHALVSKGCLTAVISALDHGISSSTNNNENSDPPLVTEPEAESLILGADAALGTVAAAVIAFLTPYPRLRESHGQSRINTLHFSVEEEDEEQGDGVGAATALPGFVSLSVVLLYRGLFPSIARTNKSLFRQLVFALLRHESSSLWMPPPPPPPSSSSMTSSFSLPPRTGFAISIASGLVNDNNTPTAAWVAMEHAGTHSFLRILDSAMTVLTTLLQAGEHTNADVDDTTTSSSTAVVDELEPAVVGAVGGVGVCAGLVLQGVGPGAAEALTLL